MTIPACQIEKEAQALDLGTKRERHGQGLCSDLMGNE